VQPEGKSIFEIGSKLKDAAFDFLHLQYWHKILIF
jgi:hypothetical protein